MKIEDITESFNDRMTQRVDADIELLVNEIRKDIRMFGNAKIDGYQSILNISGRAVQKAFGIDLEFLSRHAAGRGWVHKNGKDSYSIGYK